MQEGIEFWIENNIAVLRVNRPEARNALNWAAQEKFAELVSAVSQNPSVRVLIITGAGDKAFVAGGDIRELSNHPETADAERLNRVMSAALHQLTTLPIPVIAAINGDAFGGGCEILTACDLRLAAPHVHLSFAQIRNAVTTGWGGTGRLVRLIGQARAMELLLTGRPFSAAEALHMGFIHRVIPLGEDLLHAALAWANELLLLPRYALAANKTLVHAAAMLPLAETNQLETALFTTLWPQPDHQEAVAAFLQKRKPIFNGE